MSEGAAKVAAGRVKEGSLTAIVIFAKFKGEDSELVSPPSWAQDMFDPERPGSITHFYQTMSFGKLNIDENPDTPQKYGVRSIPTLLLFKDGKVVESTVGVAGKEQLAALLDKHVAQKIA